MSCVKKANECAADKVAQLLESIRSERPEHWPYGLSADMFDPGDLYLISKSASEDPVGFVGWQERDLEGQRVGLYSIGVLPQHRHQGIAKEAVHQLLSRKAANVDRIAALVVDGNVPSEKLAASLGVPLLKKEAGWGDVLKFLSRKRVSVPLTAWGTTAAYDMLQHPDTPALRSLIPVYDDRTRNLTNLLNAGLGAYGGLKLHGGKPMQAVSALAVQPLTKDLVANAIPTLPAIRQLPAKLNDLAQAVRDAKSTPTTPPETSPWPWLGGAALLTAGLGGAGWLVNRAIKEKAEAPVNITTNQGGRLKVTLPTRNKGDAETVLDLPFNQQRALTNALQRQLELGARRRLYEEVKERVRRRKDTAAMRELHPQMAFLPQNHKLPG